MDLDTATQTVTAFRSWKQFEAALQKGYRPTLIPHAGETAEFKEAVGVLQRELKLRGYSFWSGSKPPSNYEALKASYLRWKAAYLKSRGYRASNKYRDLTPEGRKAYDARHQKIQEGLFEAHKALKKAQRGLKTGYDYDRT